MKRASRLGCPKQSPSRGKKPVVRSAGPTASETTNYLFAISVADKVLELQPSFARGIMTVFGFTPVSRVPDAFGTFVIEIDRDKKRISLSVTFPVRSSLRRQSFETLNWYEPGKQPTRAEVRAGSSDEAWLIVCEIGQLMEVDRVCLEYGGYGF